MHWFWRAIISVTLVNGTIGLVLGFCAAERSGDTLEEAAHIAQLIAAPSALTLAVYGLLTACFPYQRTGASAYCRHCGGILRGIRSPRCPECGEKI